MKRLTLVLLSTLASISIAGTPAKQEAPKTDSAKIEKRDATIWSIAKESKAHTTLVAAIEAVQKDADAGKGRFPLVTSLTQAGPYTVFAPVNDAFDKLPKGTVEALLKDTDKLENVLLYHVFVGALDTKRLKMMAKNKVQLDQASNQKAQLGLDKNGNVTINGVPVVASIYANNGWIHVIDSVILAPSTPAKGK